MKINKISAIQRIAEEEQEANRVASLFEGRMAESASESNINL